MENQEMYLSIIVPAFNEEGNVAILHKKIVDVCKSFNRPYEVIFVNDGSSDNTLLELQKLSPIKIINFRKNFGQTSAIDAGIKESKGEILVTLDADLQNDPADIPGMIKQLSDDSCDVISGWRHDRKDSFFKKFTSRGANLLRKLLVNDGIHDSGCTLKVFKRECFDNVDLHGEMHRFIPAILKWQGYKIGERKVAHHPRIHGVTKYNWKRVIKGFLDMLSLWFWRKYSNRPLHLFGSVGLVIGFIGTSIMVITFSLRLAGIIKLAGRIWPLLGVFLMLTGLQLFIFGILADITIKSYYRQGNQQPYRIKEVIEN